jgi:vacuolar protein sorting-associated protein 41
MIETNFYICGLAPYENELLILTYFKETEDSDEVFDQISLPEIWFKFIFKEENRKPVLRIIKPYPDYYEECSVDLLNIKDYEKNKCHDYRLDFLRDENTFFVVCPKDIAVFEIFNTLK